MHKINIKRTGGHKIIIRRFFFDDIMRKTKTRS